MRYSSRLFLYAPLFMLLALAIAAALRWQSVAGGLETWLRQHNGHEIAPGVTLQFAAESMSGFPFNVDTVLRDVTFQVKSSRTSGAWHTDGFALHELTFGRTQQIYESAGTQTISWTDAEGGAHRFVFVPGSLMASAVLSRGRLVRFDLDINGIGSREIAGARLQLHFRKAPDRDAIDVSASGDQIRLAPTLQVGFGSTLRHVALDASLTPATSFAQLCEGNEVWDHGLESWRAAGGVFHLGKLQMDWDGIQIRASGNLGLDRNHQPQGTLAIAVDGAVTTSPRENTGERLARAVGQLTKITNDTPHQLSLGIVSGAVNLRLTKIPSSTTFAGSLWPLY